MSNEPVPSDGCDAGLQTTGMACQLQAPRQADSQSSRPSIHTRSSAAEARSSRRQHARPIMASRDKDDYKVQVTYGRQCNTSGPQFKTALCLHQHQPQVHQPTSLNFNLRLACLECMQGAYSRLSELALVNRLSRSWNLLLLGLTVGLADIFAACHSCPQLRLTYGST